ncbi:dTMP kinase [Nitrosophilus kaiyonis]|uniref:dTMP kinase n=1 Tax=Nitrosophilus kaiyonis TaxID=2930200 RepID=UPI002492B830|nr:dTMP kinase [Nitrosophilus kaiyonis]
MYVVLEGIDRVGKSTQIELLKKEFKDAIFTKEPGGTEFGKKIREIVLNDSISPIAEVFLFLADRNEHLEKVIKPNIKRLIISDRGFISGIAYAHIKSNLSYEKLFELNELALEEIFPDKIIFIEIDKNELEKRMHIEKLDSIEKRGVDYLLKVQNFMKEALNRSNIKHLILDANDDVLKINKKIVDFIKKG